MNEEVGFTEMARVVREALARVPHGPVTRVEEILEVDRQARAAAREAVAATRIAN